MIKMNGTEVVKTIDAKELERIKMQCNNETSLQVYGIITNFYDSIKKEVPFYFKELFTLCILDRYASSDALRAVKRTFNRIKKIRHEFFMSSYEAIHLLSYSSSLATKKEKNVSQIGKNPIDVDFFAKYPTKISGKIKIGSYSKIKSFFISLSDVNYRTIVLCNRYLIDYYSLLKNDSTIIEDSYIKSIRVSRETLRNVFKRRGLRVTLNEKSMQALYTCIARYESGLYM